MFNTKKIVLNISKIVSEINLVISDKNKEDSMLFVDFLKNQYNALVGNSQEFDELLKNKDITRVKALMTDRTDRVLQALEEYNVEAHRIMKRPDKFISSEGGKLIRKQATAKLPIPYQKYINNVALFFLYGRPIKWGQVSEGTDEAFNKFQEIIKTTRFDAQIRKAKRLAGAETQSAMLFRVYKNENGKADVQIRVLAKSKGDEIYYRKDIYENLLSVAWGYNVQEKEQKTVYHFDIFTKEKIYHCKKASIGWEVTEEINLIGKIPIILFEQEVEWAGVQRLIERKEDITSHTADDNDYFSSPILVANVDNISSLPNKEEVGKMIKVEGQDGVNALKYLTYDNAPQSKKDELEALEKQILMQSFTPEITLNSLQSLGNLSAKALRTVMMLGEIKAGVSKESHDELLSRTASLITSIIANVVDIKLKPQCDKLQITHTFQNPFGDDIQETLQSIVTSTDGGILSQEGAIELNPLVKDVAMEKQRLKEEQETRAKAQMSMFGNMGENDNNREENE